MSKEQACNVSTEATPEQLLYASILEKGANAGLLMMIISYLLYVLGVFEPHVPIETVVANWHLGINDYLAATNSPQGWNWVALLGKGDFMNFIGLALLALLTIVCYAVLIPGYLRCKDKAYTFFVIAEILVLSLAASGLVGGGGH
ncbi:DUF1634 domain-containing protein [Desulfovibrio mangrovi]|uniref:DUF1634 domain-containing protein n=1 Tax=Desulfovibrio mangrovi TaxID=2976983 RepID=UPI0022487303|nr:DUF1634 domain-containing protein [Desulfovibrio mangrovi]UZP66873.1 DUF1634 domain-containing protein [Desulfovibrio mangrovi]